MLISISLFIITIVGGLLVLKKQTSTIRYIGLSFVVIGALLSLGDAYASGHDMKDVRENLEKTKRFSVVANFGIYGGPILMGDFMKTNDPLYNKLLGTYTITENGVHFNCGAEAESIYNDVTQKYPDFPFSYYELAFCKRQRNESDWRDYAEKAVNILKWTTQVGGHKPEHDVALSELKEYLNQK